MKSEYAAILKEVIDADSAAKLEALGNDKLHAFVADAVALCRPASVKVCSDDPADAAYVRQLSIDNGEEAPLPMDGHTVHFDGFVHAKRSDQGRDPAVTKYLLPPGVDLGEQLNSTGRDEGLAEIRGFFDGAMAGRQMLVMFFCLGPIDSPFSLSCVQITDSAYVGHSEYMLYRSGYEQFRRLGDSGEFFRFLHSAGRLVNHVSADIDKRRIYIDITEDMVLSVNTQYAGNTVGLKKLALRLAIRKADREGWLAEHMFVMGCHGPGGRKTYFTGAFPSGCGKTSTAMLPGETIIGDDLAYLRAFDGQARAVNTEAGIFGIIRDVNADDDPVIHKVLTAPGEVIFGNVLITDGRPYWEGMGEELPSEGVNFSGPWQAGKKCEKGVEIPPGHWNARYTVRLSDLANLDERIDDPQGVPIGGVIYGGRDSDTSVPVRESFDWTHGIITMGAALESETTAATVGAVGVRKFDLMSNLQFLAIPLGKYIQNNLDFGNGLAEAPRIFGTNYYIRGADGEYLNGILDKAVWVKWMELRIHGDAEAIDGPTGRIPVYDDLKRLFKQVRGQEYTTDDYVKQFTIRIPENLAKLERIEAVYRKDVPDAPAALHDALAAQRGRLETLRAAKGDYVSPLEL